MWLVITKQIIIDTFWHILFAPVWWYTRGAQIAGQFALRMIGYGNDSLAPGLWLKNIFVPMYGQTDWQGRLMSFLVRFGNVVGRSFLLLVWLLVVVSVFFIWLFFPLAVVVMLLLSGSPTYYAN